MEKVAIQPVPSLVDEIVGSIIEPALQRRVFGQPYVPFKRYLGCYWEAFEVGVVLGYAFRNNTMSLARLLSRPGYEGEFSAEILPHFQGRAHASVAAQPGEPQSFIHLSWFAEAERIKSNWRDSGITGPQVAYLEEHYKMPPEDAHRNLLVAVHTGVGLGSAFPELTEKLWKTEHEYAATEEEWSAAKRLGIVVSERPEEPVTLVRRQSEILAQVTSFLMRTRPELISELGLGPP